jgi:hypothetical protein
MPTLSGLNSPRETYDKARWLRREAALCKGLKDACARFLRTTPAKDYIEEIIRMVSEKHALVNE